MKRVMSCHDVEQMNRGSTVQETPIGFEVCDEKIGVTYAVTRETDVMIDGSLFNPVSLLTVPVYLASSVIPSTIGYPLSMQFLCGNCEFVGEDQDKTLKFVPGVSFMNEASKANAMLFKVHWDIREGVSDRFWEDAVKSQFSLFHFAVVTDDYHVSGDLYWIAKLEKGVWGSSKLMALAAHYYTVLGDVLRLANEAMERFERNKALYKKLIWDIIEPIGELKEWVIQTTDDETVLRRYGEADDLLFRHDAVGFEKCARYFNWGVQEELDLNTLPE